MPYKLNPFTSSFDYYETNVSGGILHGTASGIDIYTTSIAGVTSYVDADSYLIRFTSGNTTTPTLNINGLGAKTIYRNNDGVLLGGDIWDGGEMLCVYNAVLNGFQCIGTTPNSLFAYVTNADSVIITKGMPVYAFGGTGDRMTVKRAFNTSDATSAQTVGLVFSTSIAAGQKGIIMIQGLLDGLSTLPTATFSDGDAIYLAATPGDITNVKPFAPNHLVYLGVVTTASNGSAGRMYVRVQNGYELDELHDVYLPTTPVDKESLVYNFANSRWENKKIETQMFLSSSTQWSRTTTPVSLPNGQTANGFTFFNDLTNKVANGTTSYNEFFISFTRKLTLTGTSGSENINVGGVDYLATFATSLTQTATNFVATHGAAIEAATGIKVASVGPEIRFGYSSAASLNAITISNLTPNLGGTFSTTIGDHVVIPYIGTPYDGLRILHQFRVNFGIVTGTDQVLALSLRRWADDTIIGSEIPVFRQLDVEGHQFNFISYTASSVDPFVTGGFYFALRNNSGSNVDITGNIGILVQNTFQKPVNF